MFGWLKRKKEEEYCPVFGEEKLSPEEDLPVEESEPVCASEVDPYADMEPGDVLQAPEEDGEMTRLEDGREFPAAFVREIRSLKAEELKLIIEEQAELYSAEEFAYIREVFAERLGD